MENLDCMTPDELEKQATVFATLADYALTKLAAMQARLAGDIPRALTHESDCDAIYHGLPESARW